MDTKPTRLAVRFDADRLRKLPDETTEALHEWVRSLGLDPNWVPAGSEIVIDVAEHTVTTRYLVEREGTKAKKGEPPVGIPDGNGLGLLTVAHTEKYDGKDLPEIPDALRFALVDNEHRAIGGIHGATGAL